MKNPWLEIPASDYDNHMNSPSVGQSSFMAEELKIALQKYTPDSIAILGCATGNGLEYVKNNTVKKITVFDINSEYLKLLKHRFKNRIANLETIHADLETYSLKNNEYSFILAALIFEYLTPLNLLKNIENSLKPNGIILSILQLPAENISKVSETPYKSLKKLSSIMKLISPKDFDIMITKVGLTKVESKTVTLKSGKRFYIGKYQKKDAK